MWFPTSLPPRSLISYHSVTYDSHPPSKIQSIFLQKRQDTCSIASFFLFSPKIRVLSGAIVSSQGISEVVFVLRNMMTTRLLTLLGCITIQCSDHLFPGPGILTLAWQAPSGCLLSGRTRSRSSLCTLLPQPWSESFPPSSPGCF